MKRTRVAAAVLSGLLVTGCGSGLSLYVAAGDPVLSACQSPSVQNITGLQQAVDDANNTSGGLSGGDGQQMTPEQISSLRSASKAYFALAVLTAAHPGFSGALRTAAQEFRVAAQAPDGLTVNSVAVAVDQVAGQIQGYCSEFQVGKAPGKVQPGPAIWSWALFFIVTGAYLIMAIITSYLIAMGQRSRPRKKRMDAAAICWLSVIWPGSIIWAAGAIWARLLSPVRLTADEKKDDRLAAQDAYIKKLEKANRKPIDGE